MIGARLSTTLARWRGDTRASGAIEFALVAPLFVAALVGMTELGLAVRTRLAAEEAAAAGAQAAISGFNATTITTAVQSANPDRTVRASPAPSEFYACPTVSGLTRVSQGASCTDGAAARHFADIYVTITRPTVFGGKFGMPSSYTAHATARIAAS